MIPLSIRHFCRYRHRRVRKRRSRMSPQANAQQWPVPLPLSPFFETAYGLRLHEWPSFGGPTGLHHRLSSDNVVIILARQVSEY
jgi:hypothetical protein